MIGLAWMRRIALMGAMAILAAAPSIQAQQAAASTPEGAPSVPDEPGSGSAPIFAPDTSAPARPTPMISSSVQDKLTRFSEMARTREEVRRAFLQQDYEKVLQLSREMRQISRIDERSNFYVVAAQMKMGDRQARERGDSRFQTLELEPSQTLPPIESVGEIAVQEAEERAAQTRAAQERAAQAGFGQPEMADETPTQAETGEGTLIDAAPADAPTGGGFRTRREPRVERRWVGGPRGRDADRGGDDARTARSAGAGQRSPHRTGARERPAQDDPIRHSGGLRGATDVAGGCRHATLTRFGGTRRGAGNGRPPVRFGCR